MPFRIRVAGGDGKSFEDTLRHWGPIQEKEARFPEGTRMELIIYINPRVPLSGGFHRLLTAILDEIPKLPWYREAELKVWGNNEDLSVHVSWIKRPVWSGAVLRWLSGFLAGFAIGLAIGVLVSRWDIFAHLPTIFVVGVGAIVGLWIVYFFAPIVRRAFARGSET